MAKRKQNQSKNIPFLSLVVFLSISFVASVFFNLNVSSSFFRRILGTEIRTYFVSPSGVDTNDGSQTAPYRTFAKALSVVLPGERVYLLPGTYTESIRITKSGTSLAPIIVEGASADTVVID